MDLCCFMLFIVILYYTSLLQFYGSLCETPPLNINYT